MQTPPGRKFTILDAMVLVAATAAAMALAKWRLGAPGQGLSVFKKDSLRYGISYSSLLAATWTPAWLFIRLRRPRLGNRRLLRQPGMAACGVACLGLAYTTLALMALWARYPQLQWPMTTITIWGGSSGIGMMVASAWIILAATRRWRPESSWIDRGGLVIGLYWVGVSLVNLLVM